MTTKPARKRRTPSRLPKQADFQSEAEFQRLRPGHRGPDSFVKAQLLGKLGPRGYGRLLEGLRKVAK